MLQARGELPDPALTCSGPLTSPPQAIDFDAEVNLFHFYLLRSVGKGAFGKVRSPQPPCRNDD